MRMRTHWVATIASASLLSAFACSNDGTGPNSVMRVEAIPPFPPTNMNGTAGAALSWVVGVWVTGRDEKPLPNLTVEFLVSEGSVATPTTTTDASGIAMGGAWVLSSRPGPNILSVRVAGVERLRFFATGHVGIPSSMTAAMPIDQAGLVGEAVYAPEVQVLDQYKNPITTAVTFAVTEGGGSVTGTTAISDRLGLARAGSWVLGQTPGRNVVTASVPGLASVTFVAQALDSAALTWFTLDGIRVGQTLQNPADFKIAGARLGMANLDPCLCRQGADYFIGEIDWSSGPSFHNSGRYKTDGHALQATSNVTETARFEGNTLLFDRWNKDLGYITWVYKLSSAAP